jgi:hypothetical protein
VSSLETAGGLSGGPHESRGSLSIGTGQQLIPARYVEEAIEQDVEALEIVEAGELR